MPRPRPCPCMSRTSNLSVPHSFALHDKLPDLFLLKKKKELCKVNNTKLDISLITMWWKTFPMYRYIATFTRDRVLISTGGWIH